MEIIIIGDDRLSYYLGKTFLAKGHRLNIINRNAEHCSYLAKNLKATIINGDGSDPDILYQAGAHTADVIVAATPYDQDNLVICQLSKSYFEIPQSLAMVNDPDNIVVFEKFGFKTISPTFIVGEIIDQLASFDSITHLLPIGEGKVNITEIKLTSGCPILGKQLKDINLPEQALISCIFRKDDALIPRGLTTLELNDRILVITKPEIQSDVLRIFSAD
ncbi:MAG TPA: TrkA family potassium uptake protein [Candidatus Cloacimonadota bacterium]|nr:TrkA family potassium uptake protein [Candidatus Cloacimonadota bacterium]HPT70991.1 TrkA family potassium uptake protein [Candidatus Cloacimonadota bacterium]